MAEVKEYRRLSDGVVVELTDVQFESVKDLFASVDAPTGMGSPLQQQRERAVAQQIRDQTLAYIESVATAQKKAKDAKAATDEAAQRREQEQAAAERVEAASKRLAGEDRRKSEKPARPEKNELAREENPTIPPAPSVTRPDQPVPAHLTGRAEPPAKPTNRTGKR